MRKYVSSKFLLPLAIFALVGSLGAGALAVSSHRALAKGEAEVGDSSSKSSSSSSSKSSSKSKSKSSSTKKAEDNTAARGAFSTPTDSRNGATKPEDNGI